MISSQSKRSSVSPGRVDVGADAARRAVNAARPCLGALHTASPLLSPSWSSDGPYCRVVKDSGDYVECACSHLSVYAASAEFAALASYNEAFYASGIICTSGTRAHIVSAGGNG